ncbi:MAG: helix-turn-helix domain-containing protein [Methyloprofundus sp.]|nr:helix-turn-helix domain-containing protein [Methyloprofundus sp.]
MKKITQDRAVLLWLEENITINPMQALNELGVFRLAACICRLREDGYTIITRRISKQGKHGKINFAEYRIISEVKA